MAMSDVYIVGGGPAAAMFDKHFSEFLKGKQVVRAETPSDVVAAIHAAAKRRATRSVVLVGCGGSPGRRIITDPSGLQVSRASRRWKPGDDWPEKLAAAKRQVKTEHGVNVHSLNPFINFAYEGHAFDG